MDQTLEPMGTVVPPIPTVRNVAVDQGFTWLRRGWNDLRRAAVPSITFGACVALFGMLLLLASWRATYLAPALLGGFLLVAPFVATVLYALSPRTAPPAGSRRATRAQGKSHATRPAAGACRTARRRRRT